jgi:hypothetical protein
MGLPKLSVQSRASTGSRGDRDDQRRRQPEPGEPRLIGPQFGVHRDALVQALVPAPGGEGDGRPGLFATDPALQIRSRRTALRGRALDQSTDSLDVERLEGCCSEIPGRGSGRRRSLRRRRGRGPTRSGRGRWCRRRGTGPFRRCVRRSARPAAARSSRRAGCRASRGATRVPCGPRDDSEPRHWLPLRSRCLRCRRLPAARPTPTPGSDLDFPAHPLSGSLHGHVMSCSSRWRSDCPRRR